MEFCKLIKEKRNELKLTQDNLADLLGVQKQTISNWEVGKCKPSLQEKDKEVINNISEKLDISKKIIIDSIINGTTIVLEDSVKENNKINYPFLPKEIINLKLSKEEIELLFANEVGKSLSYIDYLKIFGTGRNILSSNEKLSKISSFIGTGILAKVIRDNCFIDSFNIQELEEEDIYTIMKPFKEVFRYISNIRDKELIFFDETTLDAGNQIPLSFERRKGDKGASLVLVFKKLIEKTTMYKYKLNDDYQKILRNPWYEYVYNSYFSIVEKVSEEYTMKLNIYQEELNSWERKMIEIKKLQDLYDSEKYPDLPKPEEPKVEVKKYLALNYKGILLKKFFDKMEELEKTSSDFVIDVRKELAPYLNEKVQLIGTLVLKEDKGYLFKDLYINGQTIDHLWVYDIKDELNIGNTYSLDGVVDIYTKEVEGEDKKNYGLKVDKIEEIN